MTITVCVGIVTNAKTELLLRDKKVLSGGAILEVVIWKLPEGDIDRPHGYKYRLYYGREGVRVVGYDNARGKGEHRHYGEREEPYSFVSVEQLLDDFLADVKSEEALRWDEK